jgi:LacI family transcriptional regulator
MDKRPTLKDIAQDAGCTNATVSLALRGSPRISPETRARVQQAAATLGYRPDPMLSALAAHRWKRLPKSGGSTLAVIGDVLEGLEGMEERAAAYGYRLEKFRCADHPDPRRLSQILYNRGIVGVLVGQIFTPGFSARFDWSRFVTVACSEGIELPPVNLVMPNHFRAVQEAWDRSMAAGARRIGMMLFDIPEAIDMHDREAAFLDRQQTVPVRSRLPVLKIRSWARRGEKLAAGQISNAEAVSQVKAWMNDQKPDRILGFNDAFFWLLKDSGWSVSKKIGFTSLWLSRGPSALGGFLLHFDEVGRRAVEWLDSLLRSGERGLPAHPATMAVNLVWQDASGK